jgi:hypothetical protein
MSRRIKRSIPVLLCSLAASASASEVWDYTFSSGTNGTTQFETGPNTMIGPAGPSNNNQLQITTMDNGTDAYTPSKAGEPLGSTVTAATQSYSGLVDFTWASTDNTTGNSDAEYDWVGFMGAVTPQTRQITGIALEHWYTSGDYYVQLIPEFASVGITDVAEIKGLPAINLGSTIPSDMQFVISWDAPTETVSDDFLIDGVLTQAASANINNMYGAHPPSYDQPPYPQDEVNNQSLSYLGWEDYTGNGNNLQTVWEVNSMAYFSDSGGALTAVPEPASIALVAGACVFGLKRRSRVQTR